LGSLWIRDAFYFPELFPMVENLSARRTDRVVSGTNQPNVAAADRRTSIWPEPSIARTGKITAIRRDVDGAKTSVLMEFYIWDYGGSADDVLEAVIRAVEWGVSCRLLIDALGVRPWWKGNGPKRLWNAGVLLEEALPVAHSS
jgi:hypothetical protein